MADIPTHKVFVSFHHDDERYKNDFCRRMGGDIVDKSVDDGDIDTRIKTETIRRNIREDYIADASVVVVLVGPCTWQRKHVDWEISSGLRHTKKNPRCGLVGILLPSHPDFGRSMYRLHLVPPRLADNCDGQSPFARVYHWPRPWRTDLVRRWIHRAFDRRLEMPAPNNGRPQFGRNRSRRWSKGWTN